MIFAADYPRVQVGDLELIEFPRDTALRKEYLVSWRDSGLEADHPAKANLHLTRELIRHTTEPGNRIADITAGAGSILIALVERRDVVAIDIFKDYVDWMMLSANKIFSIIKKQHLNTNRATILNGDCRDFLPMPFDSIIFSPPYAGAFNSGGGILSRDESWGKAVEQYRQNPKNLGNLSNFLYNRAMKEIYAKCYDSLPFGGKLSLIIKDRIVKGRRVNLGLESVRMLKKVGFEVDEWHRWKPPGSIFVSIKKSKGEKVILDEHILIFRKVVIQ